MKHELLHEKAILKAKTFHRAEVELIDVLQEVDGQKTFLHYNCTSLHEYCAKFLNLSNDVAYCFIRVARKSKEVPELKESLRRREITVSKAKRIAAVITKDNSKHWLDLAKKLSKAQLEKEIAKVAPSTATPEKVKYVSGDRLQITMGVSEPCMKNFRRVQDLVSQKNRKAASLEVSLEAALEFYLKHHDPVEKAKRNIQGNLKPNPLGPGPVTRRIPTQIRHQINLRDQGQCTHVNDGQRCENKRWLETHHQIPFAQGGSHNLNNLKTLCWAHHRMRH